MVIFLYGQDDFRSRQKLSDILAHYQKKFPHSLELERFDLEEQEWQEGKSFLESTSLFGGKKLVVFSRAFSLSKETQKEILDFLTKRKWERSREVFIIFFEPREVDKRTSLFKYLKKKARFQKFNYLPPAQVKKWIEKRIEACAPGLRFSQASLKEFVRRVGADLWRASNELEKIISYKLAKGEKIIKTSDIEILVTDETPQNIFQTLDALAAKNKKRALFALKRHFERLEPELKILSMFEYQFRSLVKIKAFKERGKNYYEVQRLAGLHPFATRKLYWLADNFTLKELKEIYDKLYQLDFAFKTGRAWDKKMALEMFVIEATKG